MASVAARYSIASDSSGRPLARLDAGPTSPPTAVSGRSRDHPRAASHGPVFDADPRPGFPTPAAGLDGDCGQQIALCHPTPSFRGTVHRLCSPGPAPDPPPPKSPLGGGPAAGRADPAAGPIASIEALTLGLPGHGRPRLTPE
jgi:hypothetical protein